MTEISEGEQWQLNQRAQMPAQIDNAYGVSEIHTLPENLQMQERKDNTSTDVTEIQNLIMQRDLEEQKLSVDNEIPQAVQKLKDARNNRTPGNQSFSNRGRNTKINVQSEDQSRTPNSTNMKQKDGGPLSQSPLR